MFGATVSTPLPLLLEVPLRLRLGLRLVPRYRYCLEFRALRLGSLLGLGLPATAKARPRAIYIIAVLPIIGERSEPHTYRTVGKNLRHIYIYVFYIYIYIYTFVRRARARYAQTSDRPVEVQRSI